MVVRTLAIVVLMGLGGVIARVVSHPVDGSQAVRVAPHEQRGARASTVLDDSASEAPHLDVVEPLERAPADDTARDEPLSPADGGCHVFGRVTDDQGLALRGMTVRLDIVPRLGLDAGEEADASERGSRRTLWRSTTDASGRFSFEARLTASFTASLAVDGDELHARHRRELGDSGADGPAALHTGDDDLGDIALVTGGSLSARVVSQHGDPVPWADVQLTYPSAMTACPRAATDRSGKFRLICATPGQATIHVDLDGWTSSDVPTTVERGRAVALDDIVLRPGPRISRASGGDARVHGSLFMQAKPLAGQVVEIEREWSGRSQPPSIRHLSSELDNDARCIQAARCEPSGAFGFEGLAPGTYQLLIDGNGVARTILHDLIVAPAAKLDLGRLEVAPGAVVRVRFLTSEPESAVGFGVWIDGDAKWVGRVEKPDGTIEFSGLQAGPHALSWSRRGWNSWSAHDPDLQRFELTAGETREVLVDVRSTTPGTMTVHVTRAGQPAAGLIVQVFSKDSRNELKDGASLGTTNAEGLVSGAVPAGEGCELQLLSNAGCRLAEVHDMLLPRGAHSEQAVDIHTGTLAIELPGGVDAPQKGSIFLRLGRPTGQEQFLVANTPGMDSATPYATVWSEHEIEFGEIPAGSYQAEVEIARIEQDMLDPHLWRLAPLRPVLEVPVTIEEGREARIVVP